MYKQLTSEQRSQIFAYLQDGIARKIICDRTGISQSTLSRELKRNSGKHGRYTWRLTHRKATERRADHDGAQDEHVPADETGLKEARCRGQGRLEAPAAIQGLCPYHHH